jgi:hypothetical protein
MTAFAAHIPPVGTGERHRLGGIVLLPARVPKDEDTYVETLHPSV